MVSILHLDASARRSRSITRALSQSFVDTWLAARPDDQVFRRDLTVDPPAHVTEEWIAAAFTPPEERDASMRATLAWSETAVDELVAADVIVMGTPMYNYGMPSVLKAWFDQVVRVGRTFSFDLGRGDWPLEPLLGNKRMIVLSARGEFGFAAGELRDSWNHLDPHIATCARYLGVTGDRIDTITVEYQEFGDERHVQSRDQAARRVIALAKVMARSWAPVALGTS